MKIELDYVREYFKKFNCILLEDKYFNNHTKMKYICSCGIESTISWNNFQKRKTIKCKGKHNLTHKFVKDYFLQKNCKLLEEKYIKSNIPMSYICECGNKSKISWDNFKANHRCKKCGDKKISGSNSPFWNPDRKMVALNTSLRKKYYEAISRTLKATGRKKITKSQKLLGYSVNELKKHLQSHPKWKSICTQKWSVDHIFPISAFIEHGVFDPKIINHLDNLQPLTLKENHSKKNKYCKEKFKKWLQLHNIILN